MQAAVPPGQGAMAADTGPRGHRRRSGVPRDAEDGEVVEAVNFNAPGQVVIAGSAAAVARAIDVATARGARRAVPLPMSVPAHSSLMLPAAEQLRVRLKDTAVAPHRACRSTASMCKIHTSRTRFAPALVKQLHTPVYWAATVRTMIAAGATHIVECGPGKVLTALESPRRQESRSEDAGARGSAGLEEALAAMLALHSDAERRDCLGDRRLARHRRGHRRSLGERRRPSDRHRHHGGGRGAHQRELWRPRAAAAPCSM